MEVSDFSRKVGDYHWQILVGTGCQCLKEILQSSDFAELFQSWPKLCVHEGPEVAYELKLVM